MKSTPTCLWVVREREVRSNVQVDVSAGIRCIHRHQRLTASSCISPPRAVEDEVLEVAQNADGYLRSRLRTSQRNEQIRCQIGRLPKLTLGPQFIS